MHVIFLEWSLKQGHELIWRGEISHPFRFQTLFCKASEQHQLNRSLNEARPVARTEHSPTWGGKTTSPFWQISLAIWYPEPVVPQLSQAVCQSLTFYVLCPGLFVELFQNIKSAESCLLFCVLGWFSANLTNKNNLMNVRAGRKEGVVVQAVGFA